MHKARKDRIWAVTILELLVVVLIIGILSTVATGIYTGEVRRARIAATKDLIRQLEIAITRYEVDLGQFPPSGSGTSLTAPFPSRNGSGYLYTALTKSMSGSSYAPASELWEGPYINLQAAQIGVTNETSFNAPSDLDILDAWGNAMVYVRSSEYEDTNSSFSGGSRLFRSSFDNANPDLPAPNPLATNETYYNAQTYQIYSRGPNGITLDPLGGGILIVNYGGAESDDVNNFGY